MRIAFDSHVITYFLQANQDGYDPESDLDAVLAAQRVATFRLFLYCEEEPIVLPTVAKEVEIIPDAAIRQEHIVWTHYHWHEVLPDSLDAERLNARAQDLSKRHSGVKNANDCRIIAECEQSQVDVFVTFDTNIIRHLRDHSGTFIGTPTECWQRAAVPHGTSPHMALEPAHPLFNAGWWRW
jgi:hypothetical protein